MRENRSSGSEGGVALIPPSLPLSKAGAKGPGARISAERLERGAGPDLTPALSAPTGRGEGGACPPCAGGHSLSPPRGEGQGQR